MAPTYAVPDLLQDLFVNPFCLQISTGYSKSSASLFFSRLELRLHLNTNPKRHTNANLIVVLSLIRENPRLCKLTQWKIVPYIMNYHELFRVRFYCCLLNLMVIVA